MIIKAGPKDLPYQATMANRDLGIGHVSRMGDLLSLSFPLLQFLYLLFDSVTIWLDP